ncbi:MAG: type VI secretion system baseplate subunit TssG [Planctomycetota bacterium]
MTEAADRLREQLAAEPGRFEFDQALRLVDLLGLESGTADPSGTSTAPDREGVALRGHPSLAYASTALRAARSTDGDGIEVDVTVAGLVGAVGALPDHYSELVLARDGARDSTLRDFLDALQQRSLALLHRAWTKTRFPFAFEQETLWRNRHDGFTRAVLSLAGLGLDSTLRRQAISDLSVAHGAGAFARTTRSAESLAGLLTATFGVPFEIEQFVGHWIDIPTEERSTLLGHREAPAERHGLGTGFALGTRAWDVQSRVRAVAGPLTITQLRFFADESPGRVQVLSTLRSFLGDAMELDLECRLAPGESPGIRLGSASRLGLDTWLERDEHPDEQRMARFPLEV